MVNVRTLFCTKWLRFQDSFRTTLQFQEFPEFLHCWDPCNKPSAAPITNPSANPTLPLRMTMDVAVVRWLAGNQVDDISEGEAMQTGPARPLSTWPAWIDLANTTLKLTRSSPPCRPCDHVRPTTNTVPTSLLQLNSLTFQVMKRQFPRPYWNNNPIAQTLEMVRYILRFIITMKHVIYGAILNAARESGGVL